MHTYLLVNYYTHAVFAAVDTRLHKKLGATSSKTVYHLQDVMKSGGLALLRIDTPTSFAVSLVPGEVHFRIRDADTDLLVFANKAHLKEATHRGGVIELVLRFPYVQGNRTTSRDPAQTTLW